MSGTTANVNQLIWAGVLRARTAPTNLVNTAIPAGSAVIIGGPDYPVVPGVYDVRAYGATGNGTTDDTDAFTDAATAIQQAGGGTLFIPAGRYLLSATTYLASDTLVVGAGRGATTLLASETWPVTPPSQYAFFENLNYDAGMIIDRNITIRDMTLDYGAFGPVNPPGGGQHAIRMWFAEGVTIENVEFQCRTAEDAVAGRACVNLLVQSCAAYDARNCSWDFWEECRNVALVGNYAESALIEQHVNFNPERTGGPNSGRIASGFTMTGCHFRCTEASAAPILLSPLAGGNYVHDVVVSGNILENTYIVIRGGVTGAVIDGNTITGVLGGLSAIESYTYLGDAPVNIVISNNAIVDPATTAGNLGVIRVVCDTAMVIGNVVTGSAYGSEPGIYCGASTAVVIANNVSNGVVVATGGAINSVNSRVRNNLQFGFYDTQGTVAHFRLQSDNNFVFYGTDATGDPRSIWSVQQRSDTAPLVLTPVVALSNQLRQSVSATVAAAGTTRPGATATAGRYIVVTSCTAGVADGISLQDGPGSAQTVWNDTADVLKVYGAAGTVSIDGNPAGDPVTLAGGASATYACINTTTVKTA